MGKVRTEIVKRISLDLIDKYPYSFTIGFEENKQFLNDVGLEASKKLRNRIAGYITTVIKSDLLAKTIEASEAEAEEDVLDSVT